MSEWYEREPKRLEDEKYAMSMSFSHFQLMTLKDKRLAWYGTLRPGLLGDKGWDWTVLAVYNPSHPAQVMGGSVRVFLLKPELDFLVSTLGWRPHHLLSDPEDGYYLCTTQADDIAAGNSFAYETTAAQTLAWADKWFMCLELVLAGTMSKEEFDQSNSYGF